MSENVFVLRWCRFVVISVWGSVVNIVFKSNSIS